MNMKSDRVKAIMEKMKKLPAKPTLTAMNKELNRIAAKNKAIAEKRKKKQAKAKASVKSPSKKSKSKSPNLFTQLMKNFT